MTLVLEERYDRSQIYAIDKINEVLKRNNTKEHSIEFFVSDKFLFVRIYKV